MSRSSSKEERLLSGSCVPGPSFDGAQDDRVKSGAQDERFILRQRFLLSSVEGLRMTGVGFIPGGSG